MDEGFGLTKELILADGDLSMWLETHIDHKKTYFYFTKCGEENKQILRTFINEDDLKYVKNQIDLILKIIY